MCFRESGDLRFRRPRVVPYARGADSKEGTFPTPRTHSLKIVELPRLHISDWIGHQIPLDCSSNFFLQMLIYMRVKNDCEQRTLNFCRCSIRTRDSVIVEFAEWSKGCTHLQCYNHLSIYSWTPLSTNELSMSKSLPVLLPLRWSRADRTI